jgi:hypothetical protein
VTLFSEPSPTGRYTSADVRPFGKLVHLPRPFDLDIDTGQFSDI